MTTYIELPYFVAMLAEDGSRILPIVVFVEYKDKIHPLIHHVDFLVLESEEPERN